MSSNRLPGGGAPLLRLAWRELRGGTAAALLAVLCIAAGLAGRTAVVALADGSAEGMRREARATLGGDLEIAATRAATPAEDAAIAGALPAGTATTRVRALTTMAAAGGAARLVELKAVEPGWPLAGALLDPAGGALDPAPLHLPEPAVLVEPELLARLGCAVGDRLRLGTMEARIAGTCGGEPGAAASPFRLGPRVLLGARHLDATGLAGFGARIRHSRLALLPPGTDPGAAVRALRLALGQDPDEPPALGGPAGAPEGRFAVRSADQAAVQAQRLGERLADWLRLTALLALALAVLGVAAVVRARLHARLDTLAVLRVCGATPAQVAGLVLVQAAALGLAGGLLGGLLGGGAAALLAAGGLLPLPAGGGWSAGMLAGAALLGAGAALVAASGPLLDALAVPPLAVLRGEAAAGRARLAWLPPALGLGALALLAAHDARSWVLGPALVAAGALCWLLLALAVRLLLPLLARLDVGGPLLRLAARNLARPGLRAGAAATAMGMAGVLLGTLLAYRAALLAELGEGRREPLPSMFVIDLQGDQLEAFRALCRGHGAEPTLAPLVRARWRGGEPAAGAGERERDHARFLHRREQNLSYRERLGADETVVAGRWMGEAPARAGVVEASLEERFAARTGVRLGDTLRFDVQGETVEATVTSLRRVRWTSFRPNFFILLSPAALAELPQSWVATLPALEAGTRDRLLAGLAATCPNASAVEVGPVVARVLELIDSAGWVVRALAALAVAAGLLAVAGMAVASARARRMDAALLHALGATRLRAGALLALEFALTGAAGAALGMGLAVATGLAFTRWWLDAAAPVPWLALAATGLVITACCVAAGLAACLGALRAPPLAVLRSE